LHRTPEKKNLAQCFARPKLRHLRQIAIDEISIGIGRHQLIVVFELKVGKVVFVGEVRAAGQSTL